MNQDLTDLVFGILVLALAGVMTLKGEQTPRFKTLDAIAEALGIRVPELLVEPE